MRPSKTACVLMLMGAVTASPAKPEAPCCPHPADYFLHTGAGIGLGYYGARWHPALGVLLSAAAGIGKESLDKRYDPKDAFATIAGGLLGVGLHFALGDDDRHGIVWVGHNMLGYSIRFH